jgi:hypothetical protein
LFPMLQNSIIRLLAMSGVGLNHRQMVTVLPLNLRKLKPAKGSLFNSL